MGVLPPTSRPPHHRPHQISESAPPASTSRPAAPPASISRLPTPLPAHPAQRLHIPTPSATASPCRTPAPPASPSSAAGLPIPTPAPPASPSSTTTAGFPIRQINAAGGHYTAGKGGKGEEDEPWSAHLPAKLALRFCKFPQSPNYLRPKPPTHRWGASSRRSMASPPEHAIPVPSPPSSRLGAAADAAAASSSAPVEHPCFTLQNWWLVRVEGAERKIAVSGFTQRDDGFTSAPIAKRHGPLVLEDEDGVVVRIDGLMSLSRMRRNGFSPQICENFLIGFPSWWESWDSHFESQPTSSSNSQEDSSLIYLKFFQLGNVFQKSVASFIKNPLHHAKDFRRCVADAFTQCSRFDEYTFDNDISTKGKTAASNGASEGPAAVANEVDNMEIDLIVSSTSQERGHVDISCNASAPTENCTSDETSKEAENQNDTMHPDATEHEAGSHTVNSDLMCNRSPDCMPSDLEDGNTNAGNSTDVALCHLATVEPERDNCCSEIAVALQNIQPLSYERNPAASLKNQGHLKRTEGISLNQKAVPSEDTSTSIRRHVQSLEKTLDPSKKQRSARDKLLSPRLPGTRIPISYAHDSPLTRGRAQSLSISTPESLKMKRTKSGRVVVPPLDLGCERILYDNNHLVLGVAPVKLHSPLIKGSKPETPARKKRAR